MKTIIFLSLCATCISYAGSMSRSSEGYFSSKCKVTPSHEMCKIKG